MAAIHLRTEMEVFRDSRCQACQSHRLMLIRAVLSGRREWQQTLKGISGSRASVTTAFMCSDTAIHTNRSVSTNISEAVHSTLLLPPTEAPGSQTASACPPP